jgi:hypothetical protein
MITFYDHFGFIPLCGSFAYFFRQNGPLFACGSGHKVRQSRGNLSHDKSPAKAAMQRRPIGTHTAKLNSASDSFSKSGGVVLIILIILILVFGFGGYRMGPGIGYYGGGGISLILLIILVLLLLRVF